MDAVIHVERLTKQFTAKTKEPGILGALKSIIKPEYKTVTAVDAINIDIQEGELVGFIGPNGAGKSTTLKMLTGILWPTSGTLSVLGHNPQQERIAVAYKIGTIFGQRQQLLYHLPAIDSFNLFAKIYDVKEGDYKQRLNELVSLFELQDIIHTPVRKLSLGERMRCEFVAALLHRPKVLFLDEPTIGMDIIAKKNLREFIRKLNEREKTTIILTSHDLDDIEELCPRVIVINHGKILFDGPMDNIRKKLKYKILEIYLDKEPKTIPTIANTKIIQKSPFRITLQIDRTKVPIRKVLDAYLQKCQIADIILEDPPIEQVIERLYRA